LNKHIGLIKILLVQSQPLPAAFMAVLENNKFFSTIEYQTDANSIIIRALEGGYKIIILSLDIPHSSYLALTRQILLMIPDARILVYGIHQPEYATEYLQNGVLAYLKKGSSKHEMLAALENLRDNKRYVSATLLKALTHDRIREHFARLSMRQTK
jgi:DNA-binding NarL/FixJ family response regulator